MDPKAARTRPRGNGVRTMQTNPSKVYVGVDVRFSETGAMVPRCLIWADGTKYEIDRVMEIRRAAAMRAGGCGDRYTIRVHGQLRYLFFERTAALTENCCGRWFIERGRP